MGARIWAKKIWPAIKPDVLGRGPFFLMSAGDLTLVGWAASSSALPPSTYHRRFFSPFSIIFLIVLAVGVVLWIVRKVDDYTKHPEKYDVEVESESRDLIVSKDNEAPVMLGVHWQLPLARWLPGQSVLTQWSVTFPSGGLFGIDRDVMLQIALPDSVRTLILPEGGTVSAQLRATINAVSTVKGHLIAGVVEPENDDERTQ